MATKNITKCNLTEPNKAEFVKYESCTSADKIYLDYTGPDEKLLVLVNGSATVKFFKGDAIQGVVDVQQTITTAGAIRLDSGLFKATKTNVSTDAVKGKVRMSTSANVTVGLVQLP